MFGNLVFLYGLKLCCGGYNVLHQRIGVAFGVYG